MVEDVDQVLTTVLIVIVLLVALLAASGVRMVQQYQRGVVLRFGRLLPGVHDPGLRVLVPVADRMVKVPVQTIVLDVPPGASPRQCTLSSMPLSIFVIHPSRRW